MKPKSETIRTFNPDGSVTLETKTTVTIMPGDSLLEAEERIQEVVNETGADLTREAMARHDADGGVIMVGGIKLYPKGREPCKYQTTFGEVELARFVYQTAKGGSGYVPLEVSARIVQQSTPKMAKLVSSKYAEMSAERVATDLRENHSRNVSRGYIQDVTDAVFSIIEIEESKEWSYELPADTSRVASIGIGIDGTCVGMRAGGYREAMVGTIALLDEDGKRIATLYSATAPQYGKEDFKRGFSQCLDDITTRLPDIPRIGIADGAPENWSFLSGFTDKQILDFYHASEYLSSAVESLFEDPDKRKEWLEKACHRLKHKRGAACRLANELEMHLNTPGRISSHRKKPVVDAVRYFRNNRHRMHYYKFINDNLPIGSGVTEAACKVIVKQRLGKSGARWGHRGVETVLKLRCLHYSHGYWTQLWERLGSNIK